MIIEKGKLKHIMIPVIPLGMAESAECKGE